MNPTKHLKIPPQNRTHWVYKALGTIGTGILIFGAILGMLNTFTISLFFSSISIAIVGISWNTYQKDSSGTQKPGVWYHSISARGIAAWCTALILTSVYCILYWWPEYFGLNPNGNTGLIACFDPLSQLLKKQNASQWFVYGVFYTLAILLFGIRFILKYRTNRYQLFRTISIIFFQLVFAFLLPEIMMRLNLPYMDLKNMWPLNYYFFDTWNLQALTNAGFTGWALLAFSLLMILIISPLLTYFFGKRWYCSWVCGCGGLAETAGDSFRHLSSNSVRAWKLERLMIYSTLLFVIVMTVGVLFSYYTGETHLLGLSTATLRSWYGFAIGAVFSGVIGVGFYPLLGSRVWCRFGCPMAALLGIQQRLFSRFRITTNGGQCISCGNCSSYCEMGIDVRAYAQKGQNIVRASCVGCGICSAVCPRGVLKLENGSLDLFNRTS